MSNIHDAPFYSFKVNGVLKALLDGTRLDLTHPLRVSGAVELTSLGAGLLHADSAGAITSSAVATADFALNAVTFAILQDIATGTVVGRYDAGTGDPQTLTLNSTLETTGAGVMQRAALSGDVAASAGSNTTAIAADAVTNSKLANMATQTVKMRASAGTGDPEDGSAADLKTLLGYPTVTVDNTSPRFDGTTGNLQTSGFTINDSNEFYTLGRNGAIGTATLNPRGFASSFYVDAPSGEAVMSVGINGSVIFEFWGNTSRGTCGTYANLPLYFRVNNGDIALFTTGGKLEMLVGAIRLVNVTVATLGAGAAGDKKFASDLRVFNTAADVGTGTLQGAAAGTGGEVTHNGTAWVLPSTNITAAA